MKWSISTPWLNALLHVHRVPINLVVYQGPMKPNLGDSFALRCFQRLSKAVHSYPALPLE